MARWYIGQLGIGHDFSYSLGPSDLQGILSSLWLVGTVIDVVALVKSQVVIGWLLVRKNEHIKITNMLTNALFCEASKYNSIQSNSYLVRHLNVKDCQLQFRLHLR